MNVIDSNSLEWDVNRAYRSLYAFLRNSVLRTSPLTCFVLGLDFVGVPRQTNILDQGAALQRLGCPFDLQILDERHKSPSASLAPLLSFTIISSVTSFPF